MGPAASVVLRQEERRHAAVALGDDPEGVVAEAFGRFGRIDRIGREDTLASFDRVVVNGAIVGTYASLIAGQVPPQAVEPVFVARDRQRGRGGDDLAKIEERRVSLLMCHG